jgi:starvation-inducible outer membrane lipoprotein
MSKANNAIELPSLEEMEEMDRQQQKTIESLEISDNRKYVKCPKCGRLVAMFKNILKPHSVSNRIVTLQRHIKWAEKRIIMLMISKI